jgi:hypothetical protein
MRMLLAVVATCALHAQTTKPKPASEQDGPFYPDAIDRCLADPGVKGQLEVVATRNPLYLRGDFDGDGLPDYALVVRKPKTRNNGVLICAGRGKVTLIGRAVTDGPAFSSLPNDRFVAQNWAVFTTKEVVELTKWSSNVPRPIPDLKGEAIAMISEEAVSFIYWNGSRFRYAPATF